MKLNRGFYTLLYCISFTWIQCQSNTILTGKARNPLFDQTIASWIDFSVPILSVEEAQAKSSVQYLDAREAEEYQISHIPGAKYIGDHDWNPAALNGLSKNQTLVVYCSIGYRSEKIATKIKALGYTQVFNLYGSIFEWANQGYPLEDNNNHTTHRLHTYNKKWSKWVDNKQIEKVW